jgi:hypothetical protein
MFSAASAQQAAQNAAAEPSRTDPVQQVASTTQDTQWQPTESQRQRVVRDTYAYFAAKDERRLADAYSKFSASQKEAVPYDRWKADMESFYSTAGAVEGRTVRKVTWYKNPANAQPGIYAAVDFSSRFSKLSLHCGFVAWRQQMDGSFQVVREEENSIPEAEMSKLTPETLLKIRAQFRC